jgi:hypothetical protein
MIASDVLRALLIIDIIGMAVLSIFYLRRRPLSALAFLGWGLLAILVPILGPFFIIAYHPGKARGRLPRLRSLRSR